MGEFRSARRGLRTLNRRALRLRRFSVGLRRKRCTHQHFAFVGEIFAACEHHHRVLWLFLPSLLTASSRPVGFGEGVMASPGGAPLVNRGEGVAACAFGLQGLSRAPGQTKRG